MAITFLRSAQASLTNTISVVVSAGDFILVSAATYAPNYVNVEQPWTSATVTDSAGNAYTGIFTTATGPGAPNYATDGKTFTHMANSLYAFAQTSATITITVNTISATYPTANQNLIVQVFSGVSQTNTVYGKVWDAAGGVNMKAVDTSPGFSPTDGYLKFGTILSERAYNSVTITHDAGTVEGAFAKRETCDGDDTIGYRFSAEDYVSSSVGGDLPSADWINPDCRGVVSAALFKPADGPPPPPGPNVNESVTAASSAGRSSSLTRPRGETAKAVDAGRRTTKSPRSLTAAVVFANAATMVRSVSASNAVTVANTVARSAAVSRQLGEAITAADTPTRAGSVTRPASETATFTDTASAATVVRSVSASNAVTVADETARSSAVSRQLGEAIAAADTPTRAGSVTRPDAETATFTDTASAATVVRSVSGSSAVVVADGTARSSIQTRVVSAPVGVTDAAVRVKSVTRPAADTATFTDAAMVGVVGRQINATGAATTDGDASRAALSRGRPASNLTGFAGSSTRSLLAPRPIDGAAQVAESVIRATRRFVPAFHTFAFFSVLRTTTSLLVSGSDMARFADAAKAIFVPYEAVIAAPHVIVVSRQPAVITGAPAASAAVTISSVRAGSVSQAAPAHVIRRSV